LLWLTDRSRCQPVLAGVGGGPGRDVLVDVAELAGGGGEVPGAEQYLRLQVGDDDPGPLLWRDEGADLGQAGRPGQRAGQHLDGLLGDGGGFVVAATDAGAFALAISGAAHAVVLVIPFMLAVGMTGTALVAALVCGLKLIEGYSARRSGGQLPPSPNATRRGPQRTNRAATPGRRPQTDRGSRYPVESVHGRHFRPHLARLLLPPKGRPQSA
jgi:hypothetical protein